MKRRSIIVTAAAVLVLGLLLVWGWKQPRESKLKTNPLPETATARPNGSITPLAMAPSGEEERKQKQEERAKTVNALIERGNVPINFWGKVVDQEGRPVENVLIQYNYSVEHGNAIGVPWSDTKVFKGEVATGLDGRFAITGLQGSFMSIALLQKEGYQHDPRGAMVFNYYGHTARGKFMPDSDNPVLFVMVNKATAEPLVTHGGTFGKTMHLPGNGTPVRWNVWKGQADANGELQVTLKREPAFLARVGQPETWSAKVEVIGGGIVEASPDELTYRAPEGGYLPALNYPKVEQKQGVPARSFYIKTADGKYGRLQVELYPGDDGPTARCLIKAYMNPSGSRNLARDGAN